MPKLVSSISSKSKLTLRTGSTSQTCCLSFPSWPSSSWSVAYPAHLIAVIFGLSLQRPSVFPLLNHSYCWPPGSASPAVWPLMWVTTTDFPEPRCCPLPYVTFVAPRLIFKNPLLRNREWLFKNQLKTHFFLFHIPLTCDHLCSPVFFPVTYSPVDTSQSN